MTTEPRSAVKLEFAMSTAEVTVTAGVLFALRAAPSATTVTPSMPAAVPIWTVLPALTVVVAMSSALDRITSVPAMNLESIIAVLMLFTSMLPLAAVMK